MPETFSTKGTGISNVTHILNKDFGYPKAAGNPTDAQNHPNPVDTSGSAGSDVLTDPIVTVPGAYTSYEIPTEDGNAYTIDPNVGTGTGTVITANPIIGDDTSHTAVVSVTTVSPEGEFQVNVNIALNGGGGPSGLDSWPTVNEALLNASEEVEYHGSYSADAINKYISIYYDLVAGEFYRIIIEGDGSPHTIEDEFATGAVWNDVFQAVNSGRVYFISMYTGTIEGGHEIKSTTEGLPTEGFSWGLGWGPDNRSSYTSNEELVCLTPGGGQVINFYHYPEEIWLYVSPGAGHLNQEWILVQSVGYKINDVWYDTPMNQYVYPDEWDLCQIMATISIDTSGFDENTEWQYRRITFLSFKAY